LHLVRDSRAVAFSWRRRRRMPEVTTEERYMPLKSPVRSALYWDLENVALHVLRRSVRRYQLVRYEALTARPYEVLGGVLERLGLHADLGFLRDGRLRLGTNHTVAGNPLRFDRGEILIQPDAEWRERLGRGPRWLVTALTLPLLLRYGFLRP
ncbi:MAG: sulfotransferase, partial [Gemmatimonadales bacterium]